MQYPGSALSTVQKVPWPEDWKQDLPSIRVSNQSRSSGECRGKMASMPQHLFMLY